MSNNKALVQVAHTLKDEPPIVELDDHFINRGFLWGDRGLHFKKRSGEQYIMVKIRITADYRVPYLYKNEEGELIISYGNCDQETAHKLFLNHWK